MEPKTINPSPNEENQTARTADDPKELFDAALLPKAIEILSANSEKLDELAANVLKKLERGASLANLEQSKPSQ